MGIDIHGREGDGKGCKGQGEGGMFEIKRQDPGGGRVQARLKRLRAMRKKGAVVGFAAGIHAEEEGRLRREKCSIARCWRGGESGSAGGSWSRRVQAVSNTFVSQQADAAATLHCRQEKRLVGYRPGCPGCWCCCSAASSAPTREPSALVVFAGGC